MQILPSIEIPTPFGGTISTPPLETPPLKLPAMPDERRATFIEAMKPNFHEWDAVMNEATTLREWADRLPENTVVVSARETVRPIREIVELMQEHCPAWRYEQIPEGGHMAPLTHPDIVNPLLASILEGTSNRA